MESWNYGSEGKNCVLFHEMFSSSDAVARSERVLTGWDLKTTCNNRKNMLVSGRHAVENQGCMELGFPDMIRKPVPDNPIGGVLGGKTGSLRVAFACIDTPNALFGEKESSLKSSSSVVDSNSRDSPLMDLKLGRLTDYRDTQNGKSSQDRPVSPSAVSSIPVKRTRTMSFNSQTPFCQVHGCNMNLSSSKDYHKRHKVCDLHSKTANVVVNGIQQRFCQQCSRFHLLAEFDDGKRSCRKRLAGHNERRRKPQINILSSQMGKLFPPYHGSRFLGTSFPARTSFICPDILPSGILYPEKFKTFNSCSQRKSEDGLVYSPPLALPITNGHLLPKSFLPTYGVEKPYPSLHDNGIDPATGSIFYENSYQHPPDLTGPNSVSRSLFQNTSSESEDFTIFDTASTIQGLSGVSDPGCALSLLSSHSQNLPSHSLGIQMARPLISQSDPAYYSVGQINERLLGITSQASTVVASNRFSSSGMNSVEVDHLHPTRVSYASNSVNFEVHTDGIFQGSDFVNAKDPLSHEHGPTVDLLQLSSQLQRV
ncbi:hypothetical protein HHK36_015521 [Tetracentron sinense]|uniref:SBP-type domain-containing protein n=1 Tax=Tetracentron sinense TaxID=13715 RepID=A0A834Z9D8_TETSI|nr:hypothetical protein HHK36_015521 [Tetracentron sinense]